MIQSEIKLRLALLKEHRALVRRIPLQGVYVLLRNGSVVNVYSRYRKALTVMAEKAKKLRELGFTVTESACDKHPYLGD